VAVVLLVVVVSFIEFGVVDARRETTTARARKKSRFRI